MASAIEIIGATIGAMETDFDNRMPAVEIENISQIGQYITSSKNVMNDFVTTLINKVAVSNLVSKLYRNPLEKLKSGQGKPFGSTIEEVFVNPNTDMGYQKDGALLLRTFTPDGKSAYYGLNRQGEYATSIQVDQLMQAFHDERSFNNFYNGIISALYSGDSVDEFDLTKKMLGKNIDDGHILTVEVELSKPKDIAKAITNFGDYFTFENTKYNGYNLVNKEKITSGEKPVKTFTPASDQALLIRSDIMNEINYEVLASMFHMEVAELKQMTVKVDSFLSKNHKVYAVLVDVNALNIIDKVFETDTFYNGANRVFNVFLHHWQWIYLSMFGNCVAFIEKENA